MTVLHSTLDASVNFIAKKEIGFIEARYVRRVRDYMVGYLSSQTGCNKSCGFCHLTTMNQKRFENCTQKDFMAQAYSILEHYKTQEKAEFINWNYMARGEPLSNPVLVNDAANHFAELYTISEAYGLKPRFNISTIMPNSLRKSPASMFSKGFRPTIYYSIYSVNKDFRKRWLPSAMPVDEALALLAEYQISTGAEIVFHGAFIKGQNDSREDILALMTSIQSYNIQGRFNIVHYNPYSENEGEESNAIKEIAHTISYFMPVQVVSRVGLDVHASCGMFIEKT